MGRVLCFLMRNAILLCILSVRVVADLLLQPEQLCKKMQQLLDMHPQGKYPRWSHAFVKIRKSHVALTHKRVTRMTWTGTLGARGTLCRRRKEPFPSLTANAALVLTTAVFLPGAWCWCDTLQKPPVLVCFEEWSDADFVNVFLWDHGGSSLKFSEALNLWWWMF